jgi:hypothetical protein
LQILGRQTEEICTVSERCDKVGREMAELLQTLQSKTHARAEHDWAEVVKGMERRPTWQQLREELDKKAGTQVSVISYKLHMISYYSRVNLCAN